MASRYGLLIVLLTALVAGAARAEQPTVAEIEAALKAKDAPAVHDFGHLLKPGGVREMERAAADLRNDHINVYFVTVPRGSMNVDGMAERVYRDLNGSPEDMLVMFDGNRVYGKTLALKGNPRAFSDAFNESRPGFRAYYAKGLVQFAQALRRRIDQRRKRGDAGEPEEAAPVAAQPQPSFPWAAVGGVAVAIGVGAVALRQASHVNAHRARYRDELAKAEQAYREATLAMPDPAPAELASAWRRLDEKLERCRRDRNASLAQVMDLRSDLEEFDRRVRREAGTA